LVDPNTRQGKRTPVTLKIKFKSETLEQFIERYAVDVSQGGIFIRTKEPLAVGTQMRFEFQLRDASPLIAGEGTVVWTRENDPSRPAIAPGMGVRFDRLADGSQGVLERILAEKAKQAPQRTTPETTKPPMFTDTPTRVAPPPVQDALLHNDRPRKRPDSYGEHTPLPKPTPWHSDADEFPEEAFEEATKVRSLDDLVAQGAIDAAATGASDELAARRSVPRADATVEDAAERAPTTNLAEVDRESAPGLPSPPESAPRPQPRMLDTTPSPRTEVSTPPPAQAPAPAPAPALPPNDGARTRLGVEPARAAARQSEPAFVAKDAPTKSSGMRAVAAEPSGAMPAARKSSAPMLILVLLLVAVGGGAVWFFKLRETAEEAVASKGSNTAGPATRGSGTGSGGAINAGNGSNGSAVAANGSEGTTMVGSNGTGSAPKAELVETVITASVDKATIEIAGTDQTGPSPLKAKLEKGKAYKARVAAPGFATLELDVEGGADKLQAKLTAKPRLISVTSEPPGALIFIDNSVTGHSTPFDVELTKAQGAKKSIRLMLRKSGYRTLERVISLDKFTEDATQMVYAFDERMSVQVQVTNPNTTIKNTGSGSAQAGSAETGTTPGSAATGSGTTPGSASTGSGSTGSAAGSAAPVKDAPHTGSAEPEPDFTKKP
jgi:uncharacterized protein (TIGR02266 family)